MNTYVAAECAVFFKTREEYGELSNMRHGFVLRWHGRRVHSSEALYQAHKFLPETRIFDPDLGKEVSPFEVVIAQTNAKTAKMKAKKYKRVTRPDWHSIKLDVMNYCVRLKYLEHRSVLDDVLDDTMGAPIVEKSRTDQLWGAVNDYRGNLVGENLLGCLWMIIRDERPCVMLPETMF
jgi:ribA/ribD-fused uncharacterized protein